ncbi:helix-turn-helix domain-containing protein [Rothia sp. 88186D007BW]
MSEHTIHGFLQEIGSVLLQASAYPQQPRNHSHQLWKLELPSNRTVTFSTHLFETVGASQMLQLTSLEGPNHYNKSDNDTSPCLVIASTITAKAREQLIRTGSSYIALHQGSAYLDGTFYQQKHAVSSSGKTPRPLPWNLYALARFIIFSPTIPHQQEIADILNTTQPTISRTFSLLRHNLKQFDSSTSLTQKSNLLSWLEHVYPTKHDFTIYWSSSAPLAQQIKTVQKVLSATGTPSAVAGVAASDMYSPWKHPQTGLILTSKITDFEEEGFFESSPEKATMQISIPADPTRFTTAQWWSDESGLPGIYTDPVDTYLTLLRSKEADIREAAQILKTKILEGVMK